MLFEEALQILGCCINVLHCNSFEAWPCCTFKDLIQLGWTIWFIPVKAYREVFEVRSHGKDIGQLSIIAICLRQLASSTPISFPLSSILVEIASSKVVSW